MHDKSTQRPAAIRRARMLGIGAYSLFMTSVAGLWGIQVMRQVWFPDAEPVRDCDAAIATLRLGLANASRVAREAADENAALAAFRAHIATLWPIRHGLETSCTGSPRIHAALAALDQRRYGEEAALRLADGADARQDEVLVQFRPK